MNACSKKVSVLCGGNSCEREVSLRSGERVFQALTELDQSSIDPQKTVLDDPDQLIGVMEGVDVIFNCLHGGIGEDGTLQSLFELLEVSYTGSGPMSCAAAMNKVRAKQFFREAGLQTPRWLEFDHSNIQHFITKVTDSFDFPVVIKPVDCGSSVGVRIVQHKRELPEEVRGARDRFDSFLIEEFIPGKEITAGVLELKGKATPLPLIELRVLHEEFYNFKAKYTPGETEFFVPADLPPPTEEKLKQAALAAHRQLDCSDYSRVDIRLTESGTPFLLEINALPGMTETSDLPLAAEALDIDYPSLVRHMLDSALEDL